MNTNKVFWGACVAGVATAAVVVKNNLDARSIKIAYGEEIETLNTISSTDHGTADVARLRAQKLHDSLDPETAKIVNREMILGSEAKSVEEKIVHYQRAVDADPKCFDAMQLLAFNLKENREYEKAKVYFQKIIDECDLKIKVRIASRQLDKLKNNNL